MTRVRIDLRRQTGAGDVPLDGYLRIAPVLRRVASDGGVTYEVLPTGFAAAPQSVVDVTPSADGDAICAYAVVEEVPGGRRRWVLVPDTAEVAYSDLAEVDPATLEPGADPDPAWWAALTDYRTETTAARDEAHVFASDAAGSASSSASSAGAAASSASQASGSADAAVQSAVDAAAAESAAEGSAAAAAASATAADSSALAAGTAQSGAVSARQAAESARDTASGHAATATTRASEAAASAATAVSARDATLAASTIVGAGRPDVPASMTPAVAALVAAATSGAVFRSTDGPQGAWEWQKRGATWVVTDGELLLQIVAWDGAGVITQGILGSTWEPVATGSTGGIWMYRTPTSTSAIISPVRKVGSDAPLLLENYPQGMAPSKPLTTLVAVNTQSTAALRARRLTWSATIIWPGMDPTEVLGQGNSGSAVQVTAPCYRSWPLALTP